MNYAEQAQFLNRGRAWGAAFAGSLILWAALALLGDPTPSTAGRIARGLTLAALAFSAFYTPDYLHLTVNPGKQIRWAVKIRWRMAAIVFLAGLFLIYGGGSIGAFLAAVSLLAGSNLVVKPSISPRHIAGYFWSIDFVLLAALLLGTRFDLLAGAALLALAAHFSILLCAKRALPWAVVVTACGMFLLVLGGGRRGASLSSSLLAASLMFISALGTALLVRRAQQWNERNVHIAMQELRDFTGYSDDQIRHLWAVSNAALAKNWKAAAIPEDDGEKMAAWYRANSELYLFAISAYNLDYKRIRSSLDVLKFARGACFDYGAGNGEILLELARRGHPVTYFDVEGETMKFARQRAGQRNLSVEFLHDKKDLAPGARKHGFDTVFAFDVLEHLPDLAGEIEFLCSLLNPGGLLVFDVPAGSTQSHPMHLNHNLDVTRLLRSKGLRDQRTLPQKLSLQKQEKFIYGARP